MKGAIIEVRSTPLACSDACTVRDDRDLVHAWYYFPRMKRDEALLIQHRDSSDEAAKFLHHNAFADLSSPPDVPAREIIEVRLVVVY